MRSCDIHNLQFESVYNEKLRTYTVKRGSERLYCPKCHYEHKEEDKAWCIKNGAYVHLVPELVRERPSFQIGALASQLPSLSWSELAEAQLESGKTADISIQQNFDNSYRGLPFKPRQITKDEISSLREQHIWKTPPTLENTELLFVTSDTMDDFSSYAVWAWTTDDSLYLIECGEVPYIELTEDKRNSINEELKAEGKPPVKTLDDVIFKDYLKNDDGTGLKPLFTILDVGGHNSEAVKHFAFTRSNVFMQKRYINDKSELEME